MHAYTHIGTHIQTDRHTHIHTLTKDRHIHSHTHTHLTENSYSYLEVTMTKLLSFTLYLSLSLFLSVTLSLCLFQTNMFCICNHYLLLHFPFFSYSLFCLLKDNSTIFQPGPFFLIYLYLYGFFIFSDCSCQELGTSQIN